MNKFVKSDLYRYTGKKTVGAAVKQFFINRAFRIQVFIRLSNGGGYRGRLQKSCTMQIVTFTPIFKSAIDAR